MKQNKKEKIQFTTFDRQDKIEALANTQMYTHDVFFFAWTFLPID